MPEVGLGKPLEDLGREMGLGKEILPLDRGLVGKEISWRPRVGKEMPSSAGPGREAHFIFATKKIIQFGPVEHKMMSPTCREPFFNFHRKCHFLLIHRFLSILNFIHFIGFIYSLLFIFSEMFRSLKRLIFFHILQICKIHLI